ncbi:hypothetical protein RRF57_000027 [Xylaria bambusicola]|uniref:Uncharacterized protein n=1 Tax=Xylaria bambusicola TaxID=326684 RepID=A0AAN7UC72_9PEZI
MVPAAPTKTAAQSLPGNVLTTSRGTHFNSMTALPRTHPIPQNPKAILFANTCPKLTDAVDAETPLREEELQVLRAQYEKEGDMVGVQTKFNYAWKQPADGSTPTIRNISSSARASSRMSLLSCLGKLQAGQLWRGEALQRSTPGKEPANLQASDLRRLIDDKVTKEGLMGVAIISGVAIAAGVVGGILFRGKRR